VCKCLFKVRPFKMVSVQSKPFKRICSLLMAGCGADWDYSVFERSVEQFAVRENASRYKVRASVLIQLEPIRL